MKNDKNLWLMANNWHLCPEHKVQYPRKTGCPKCEKPKMKNNTKQVIVIRKDLKMRKGKMVSQGAHSAMKVFFDRGYVQHDEHGLPSLVVPLTTDMVEWIENIFTKICVSVNSEEELLAIHSLAESLDIPCSLIQDVGLTEFGGIPTYTAVAVGPAKNEDVDKVTKGLPLL